MGFWKRALKIFRNFENEYDEFKINENDSERVFENSSAR